MEQNQHGQPDGDTAKEQPTEKTNEDYNGKAPLPYDPDFTKLYPDKEVPNIVANDEELSDYETADEDEYVPNSRKNTDEPTYLDIIDE